VPPQWVLGSPVFSGGYLYLSGFRCAVIYYATCLKHSGNAIYLARVGATPLAWNNAASYQWYAGRAGWTAAAVLAASVIGGVTPLAVSVDDFTGVGRGFVLIEETTGGGGFTLYQAAAPAGPWRRIRDGRVPCTADKRAGGLGLCRALIPHPELSTRDGLLISFFNPQDDHVEVAAQSW
jgi:hypothetical protein